MTPDSRELLADKFEAWVKQYSERTSPPGCLLTPEQDREVVLFADIYKALRSAALPKQADSTRDALTFYADQRNYLSGDTHIDGMTRPVMQDRGSKARAALSAPVPSPDPGLDKFKQDVAAYYVPSPDGARREVETTLQMINAAAADAALRDTSTTRAAEPDAVRDLPLLWNGRANTLRILNGKRAQIDQATCGEADCYEQCAKELRELLSTPAVHDEHHIARFLARLIYRRGVAYGPGLESADTWVDANWQAFREDTRRLGSIAPAVWATTRKKRAEQIQSILAETLVIQDGEIIGTGPASYKIADVLSTAVGMTRELIQEACDLLAERKYGNPAWSPGHNARLLLESILLSPVPDATVSAGPTGIEAAKIVADYLAMRSTLDEGDAANIIQILHQSGVHFASSRDVDREATVEAFAKSLEVRAAGYAARGDSIFNGSIIAEELTEQARRLRALAANGGTRLP